MKPISWTVTLAIDSSSDRLMKVRDLLRVLRQDGWYLAQTKGSHHQFKHPVKPGRVTVAGKVGDDISIGTLKSILRQAGLANPTQG